MSILSVCLVQSTLKRTTLFVRIEKSYFIVRWLIFVVLFFNMGYTPITVHNKKPSSFLKCFRATTIPHVSTESQWRSLSGEVTRYMRNLGFPLR